MTKRRAENVLPPDIIPHKRCLRSLSNIDDKPVGGVTTMQSGNPPQLSSNLGQRCRKRPNFNEYSPTNVTGDMPRKLRLQVVKAMSGDNTCKSRKFEDARKPVARSSSHALEVESKKEKDDENTTGSKVIHADEDLSAFNTFQFWRVPLPELDLSLLETESSVGPNDSIPTKDLEAMET